MAPFLLNIPSIKTICNHRSKPQTMKQPYGLSWTPYRLLCNDVQREDAKPSPDLASWLYSNVPLHKIRYGIPSIVQGLFMPVNSARMSVAWTVICMKPVLQRLKRRVHPRKLHIELFIERSLLRIYLLNCF